MFKITPEFVLFPIKLGGTIKLVPLPISEKKQYTFATKFIIKVIRDKFGHITIKLIVDALIYAISGSGYAIEKKLQMHETALSNRHLIKFFK